MEIRLPIPHVYRTFAKGSENQEKRIELYYRYAASYFRKNYVELEVVRFEKDQAICIKKAE